MGDGMEQKINVLGIDIDNCTAKEALRRTIEYMDSVPVSTVEMLTVDSLMQMDERPEIKEEVGSFDLVMPADKTLLEAADITDGKNLRETKEQMFLKLFLRYLHKNHKRVYLLVESEEEGQRFFDYLQKNYEGVQVVGLAKVSARNRADDMLVNAKNGGEVDCVIAALSAPLQEEFIIRNRNLLDVRIFLGLGKRTLPDLQNGVFSDRVGRFLMKYIFKREIEKRKQK